MPTERRAWPLVAVLATALTVLVYVPGLDGGFAFDDYALIVDNAFIRVDSMRPGALLDAAFMTGQGGLRRPLSLLSFAASHAFFGASAWHYKAVNLALHVVNAGLLWWLLALLLPRIAADVSRAAWLAAACAVLWAVHPVNLTSVLYVVQRMTSLASLAMLAAMLCYASARLRGPLRPRHLVTLALLWALGLLCKETAALLPVYLVVIEAFAFGGRERWRASCRQRPAVSIILLVAGAGGCVALIVLAPDLFPSYRMRAFSPLERLMTEARVVLSYVVMLVVPEPGRFALFHDDVMLSRGLLQPWTTLPAAALMVAALATVVLARVRLLAFGIAWFVGGHLLESTILPLELVHEHRNYLPGVGILLLVVAAIDACLRDRRTPAAIAVALVIFACAAATWSRAADWSSPWRQMAVEVADHPHSQRTLYEFGRIAVDVATAQGDGALRAQGLDAIARSIDGHSRPFLPLAALLNSALVEGDAERVQHWLQRAVTWPDAAVRLAVLRVVVNCQVRRACPPAPAPVLTLVSDLAGERSRLWLERNALQLLATWYVRVAGDGAAARRVVDDLVGQGRRNFRARTLELLAASGDRARAAREARTLLGQAPFHLPLSNRPLWHRLRQLAALAP